MMPQVQVLEAEELLFNVGVAVEVWRAAIPLERKIICGSGSIFHRSSIWADHFVEMVLQAMRWHLHGVGELPVGDDGDAIQARNGHAARSFALVFM